MTRIILTGTFWLSTLMVSGYAQTRDLAREVPPHLSNTKPTVYLTFERAGNREPVHTSESRLGIWLRLHNNTKWAINFCTPGLYLPPRVAPRYLADDRSVLALKEGVEISICHGVEQIRRYEWNFGPPKGARNNSSAKAKRQVGYDTGDVSSSTWLPSGTSVVFSVPAEHLSEDLAIFLRFNYEWEFRDRSYTRDEPEHRVYFRAAELPKKLQ